MQSPRALRLAEKGFDPEALRRSLPDFDRGTLQVPGDQTLAYLDFYGLDLAARFRAIHHFGAVDAAGYRLACHHFALPGSRGSCLITHGYLDHAGLYRHLAAHCLAAGFDVLLWDLPGHGLSSGESGDIDDFRRYTEALHGVLATLGTGLPRPWHALGQSTGAAVLLDTLLSAEEPPFEQMTLLAPLIRARGWRSATLLQSVLRPFRGTVKRKFVSNSGDTDFLDFVRHRDPLQSRTIPLRWLRAMFAWSARFDGLPASEFPLHVIQGEQDGTVAWQHNLRRLEQKFSRLRVTRIAAAGHHLVNESPALRESIFSAIELSNE